MKMQALILGVAVAVFATGCGKFASQKGVSQNAVTGAPIGGGIIDDPAKDDEAMEAINPTVSALAEKYFGGDQTGPAKTRLFRLTREQLDLTTKAVLSTNVTTSVKATMPRDPLQTNYEYSDVLSFNNANFTPYSKWVEQIAKAVLAKPTSVINCASTTPSCLETQARAFITKAFRGAVTEERLATYVSFYTSSVSQVGFAQATADLVDVVMSSPLYVFREEVQTDSSGILNPAQYLQGLSYALADSPPDRVKLSSANPVQHLQSAEALKSSVDAVLSTPEAREKLLRFFAAWLEIKEADEFTISTTEYPEFTPAVAQAVVEETKKFLNFHLSKAAPSLKDLTQSTQSFVSDSIASIYGMNQGGLSGASTVALDTSKRVGLFTQPAVLASHSGPTTTRLVKRGVFFTRKVMCLEIGGVPSGIDTELPDTNGQTERQKIEAVTSTGTCVGCHTYINPFGFIQENYSAIGKWRTTDEGQPIDSRISVNFLDEGQLNTDSPVTALKTFTNSARFKQCFVRQLFRFYMGRTETPADHPLLRKMFFYFAEGDQQDILGLLKILGNSSRFAQRSEGGV